MWYRSINDRLEGSQALRQFLILTDEFNLDKK